jgi:hypothetical protein
MTKDIQEIGGEIIHLLKHISDFEVRMIDELDEIVARASKSYVVVSLNQADHE